MSMDSSLKKWKIRWEERLEFFSSHKFHALKSNEKGIDLLAFIICLLILGARRLAETFWANGWYVSTEPWRLLQNGTRSTKERWCKATQPKSSNAEPTISKPSQSNACSNARYTCRNARYRTDAEWYSQYTITTKPPSSPRERGSKAVRKYGNHFYCNFKKISTMILSISSYLLPFVSYSLFIIVSLKFIQHVVPFSKIFLCKQNLINPHRPTIL